MGGTIWPRGFICQSIRPEEEQIILGSPRISCVFGLGWVFAVGQDVNYTLRTEVDDGYRNEN